MSPRPTRRDQRSTGTIRLGLASRAGRTVLTEAYQSGSAKLRFARTAPDREASVLNTSGGLASGDRFDVAVDASAAVLTVTTQACERVYRSDGEPARVAQTLCVGEEGRLYWLPQPTILFDGARLERRTEIAVERGGRLTFCEGLVFGRKAMGETLRSLSVVDRTTVRRDGVLRWADVARLSAADLSGAAGLDGAVGAGLIVHVDEAPADAVARLREALASDAIVAGASVVNGIALARVLAPSHQVLQDRLARGVTALTGRVMPRAWSL